VINFVMAQTADPASCRHASANGNEPRTVADLHTVKIKSLAIVTLHLSIASTIVKGFNETNDLDQLAIVP
jgi:hypothetical protein